MNVDIELIKRDNTVQVISLDYDQAKKSSVIEHEGTLYHYESFDRNSMSAVFVESERTWEDLPEEA